MQSGVSFAGLFTRVLTGHASISSEGVWTQERLRSLHVLAACSSLKVLVILFPRWQTRTYVLEFRPPQGGPLLLVFARVRPWPPVLLPSSLPRPH